MTTTDPQPIDLDAIRRALAIYGQTGSDDVAHELTADVPALAAEVERLRAGYAELGRVFDATVEVARSNKRRAATLAAVVDAAYAFADEMAGYCSPHAVSSMYAKRLREALDRAKPTDPAA